MKKLGEGTPSFVLPKDDQLSLFRAIEVLRNRVVGAINQLVGGRTVDSSAEWDTAKTWTDGSAIYATYVALGALPNATTSSDAHGATGIDTVVGLYGFASDGAGKDLALPNDDLQLHRDGLNIKVTTTSDYSGYTGWAVMEYTKA